MSSKKRKVGGDAPPARVEDDTDEEDGGHPRPGSGVGGGASAPDDEEMGGVPLAGKRPRASMSQSDAGKGRASFTKAGTVMSVHMINLRCHPKMPVELCPGATFIIGRNGSGKSTVAIAIQLALGMKLVKPQANSWGFVRTGAANGEAQVEVELYNGGPDAYRPEVYGPSIVIRRKLTYNVDKQAYSSDRTEVLAGPYDAANPKGMKVVVKDNSDAKSEVVRACASFNIAWDNPVMIMDQEQSKAFLTGKPDLQYKFFLSATGLKEQYEQIGNFRFSLTCLKKNLSTMKTSTEELESKLKVAKGQFDKVKDLKSMQQNIEMLDKAETWAEVVQLDAEIISHRASADEVQERVEKVKGIRTQLGEKVEAARAKEAAQRDKLDEVERLRKEHKDALDEANDNVELALTAVAQSTAEIKRKAGEVAKAKKAVDGKLAALSSVRNEIAKHKAAASKVSKASRVEAAEADVVALGDEVAQSQELVDSAEKDLEAATKALTGARRQQSDADGKLRQVQHELGMLEKATNKELEDPLFSYTQKNKPYTTNFVRLFHLFNANKAAFKAHPVGPVGSVVRLKDMTWQRSAEAATPNLHAFICTSKEDVTALEQIVKQKDPGLSKSLEYVARPGKGRIPARSAPAGQTTLLDIMDVEPEAAWNHVLDSARADTTLLLEDSVDASAVLRAHPGYTGINRDAFKLSYHPSGLTMHAMTPKDSGFMRGPKVDKTTQVAALRQQLSAAEKEARGVQVQLTAADGAAVSAHKTFDLESGKLAKKKARLSDAERAYKAALRLPEDAPMDEEDDAENVMRAEADVDSARHMLSTAEARLATAREEEKPVKAALDAAENALKLVRKNSDEEAISAAIKAIEAAQESVQKAEDMLAKCETKLQDVGDLLAKALAGVESREKRRADVHAAARASTGLTGQYPMYDKMDKDEIRATRKGYQEQMSKAEKAYGGEGAYKRAEAAYKGAAEEFAESKNQISEIEVTAAKIDKEYVYARNKFFDGREQYSAMIAREFAQRCHSKGHKGAIVFQHSKDAKGGDSENDNGLVQVYVIPDAVSRRLVHLDAVKDGSEVSSLSGGEKSFASLILLSAIARVAAPSFRIIDEFDVFQDEATRRQSMKYLLDDATSSPGYAAPQFILLTPHDISAGIGGSEQLIKAGMLKVLRMAAPRED